MKKLILLTLLAIALVPAMAQNNGGHNCGNCPHHQQHQAQQRQAQCQDHQGQDCSSQCSQKKDPNAIPSEIIAAFPTAKVVKKEAKRSLVYDAKKVLLGYVVYSKPASNGIKGYAGETPLMVAFGTNDKVLKVVLLNNNETPSYLSRVVNAGLLKSWDGLKTKKALKKKVDTVSGATYTSRSIIQTLQAALKSL